MKKLLIALIALTTLAIFVACNPAKDPVKDNLAIGNWVYETEEIVWSLEVKNDKTATMYTKIKEPPEYGTTFKGSWTATSITEGTISLVDINNEEKTFQGPFKAESNTLTITVEDVEEPIVFKKALK